MKIDKLEVFHTVVWVTVVIFAFQVFYYNFSLQDERAELNNKLDKIYSKYCPSINYSTDDCKEYKEKEEDFQRFHKQVIASFYKEIKEEKRQMCIKEFGLKE